MTHASPEEIHDHAYGFRVSEHVATCPDCRRSAEAVAVERETLKDALREDPVAAPADLCVRIEQARARRGRLSVPALAAAVLLLGALAWLLFQPKSPVDAPAPASTPEEDLEKIVDQLKNASPLRQDLARLALRKYGGSAVPALERAKADPVLIEECRGFSKKDQEAYRKAQSTRLDVAWKDVPLLEAIDQLRLASGLNFHVSGVSNPSGIQVTLSLKNASVVEILDQLKTLTQLPWGRTRGLGQKESERERPPDHDPVYLFGAETPPAPSSAPVRILSTRAWAAEQLRHAPGRRTEVELERLFLRLTQSADPTLWDYLDSPRPELRRLAEESLRRLYGPAPVETPVEMEKVLRKTVIDLSFENQPYGDLLLDLGFQEGVALVLDPRLEIPVTPGTMKSKGLSLKNSLTLVLSQQSLSAGMFGEVLWITKPEWLPFRSPEGGPLWTTPDEAARAEAVIDDLASDDPARQERARASAREAGRSGLAWLSQGRLGVDSALAPRYSEALRAQASQSGIVLCESSGGAHQQDLTSAQLALLGRPLSLRTRGQSLEAILTGNGVKLRLQAPGTGPLLVSSPALRIDSLLASVTQPLGLDFYLDGDTIVVDTAEKVRRAVQKK